LAEFKKRRSFGIFFSFYINGILFQKRKGCETLSGIGLKISTSFVLIWLATIVIVNADNVTSSQTGTIDDPLITKSYFDQNIAQRIKDELSKQSMTEDKIKQLISSEISKLNPINDPGSSSSNMSMSVSLTVINLQPGQTLYGGSGTELIVRTGKVTVVSSDENGIPDVTSGKDISTGNTVELNHLLIVPREGRGVKADPKLKQDTYIMVRGNYTIVNPDGSKATS
jgi:hypothetical protein